MIFSKEQIGLLAGKITRAISVGNEKIVINLLKPILDKKISFSKLDELGKQIGKGSINQPEKFFKVCDVIVEHNAMGGFVIVGRALVEFLADNFGVKRRKINAKLHNFAKVMEKSREYIIKGDKWYVCDIIGERSLGQALVDYFDKTLPWLEKFLKDKNKWVKRSAGVAVHFFSKRVKTEPEKTRRLLRLIEPYIEEKQVDVVKGIGWGLKTIGKYHPDILMKFLKKQLRAKKKISKLMTRKALTYLNNDRKKEIEKLVRN